MKQIAAAAKMPRMSATKVSHQLAVSQRRFFVSHGLSCFVSCDLRRVDWRGFFWVSGSAMTDVEADKGGTGGGDHMEEGREAGDRKGDLKTVVALLERGSCGSRCKFVKENEPLNDL
ncbi:hypothetical protein BDR04DRAFT_1102978 [Suillus decipiens]|nr:hypothetical protein BDR04DRAFT_1102978 [Suillus decipiens]